MKNIAKFELDAVKNIKLNIIWRTKKVSIAMALLSNPKIVLMDEPFQGLDLMSTNYLETIVIYKWDINRCCIDHAAKGLLKKPSCSLQIKKYCTGNWRFN